MIIPPFQLTQTPNTVTLEITAKYLNIKDLELIIEEEQVFFYCKPYHLKLRLPGRLENEILDSKYDIDTGKLIFVMKKSIPDEHFENLNLIIRLLNPVDEKKEKNKVLILDDEENVLWEDTPQGSFKYGFAMKGLYDFHRVIDEYSGVIKIDPRKIDIDERSVLQREDELAKFNPEHYEADFVEESDSIRMLIEMKSPWDDESQEMISFDSSEIDILKDLPNKNYSLTEEQKAFCYNSLIDILYAFCYDCRSTAFEGNSESGWTIIEIAASLSWLVGFSNVKSAVMSSFRRSLIYPLYRNFNFSCKILEDLKTILKLGPVAIVKCLIEIYKIFLTGDCCRYILNDIFIKDYIIYVSKWDSNEWRAIVDEVQKFSIGKEDLGLGLQCIEKKIIKHILNSEELDSDDEPNQDEYYITDAQKESFNEKLNDLEENEGKNVEAKLTAKFSELSFDLSVE